MLMGACVAQTREGLAWPHVWLSPSDPSRWGRSWAQRGTPVLRWGSRALDGVSSLGNPRPWVLAGGGRVAEVGGYWHLSPLGHGVGLTCTPCALGTASIAYRPYS